MSIEHKRTAILTRTRKLLPDGCNTRTGIHTLENGEKIHHIYVQDGRQARDYICALELTAISFEYVPTTQEVMYSIYRLRNHLYTDGAIPPPGKVQLWKDYDGCYYIKIIQKLNISHHQGDFAYIRGWIEDQLWELED